MPKPTPPPTVPLELWKRAVDSTLAFRALAPWEWMHDSEVCVLIDGGGTPWFASVLGAAGVVRGLALYRGEQGLRVLRLMLDARAPEDMDAVAYQQDALTVWFGSKAELDPQQRDRYATLDYRPANGTRWAWPSILNHRPGYRAWAPTADELKWLMLVVPAILRYAAYRRAVPGMLAHRAACEFPTVPLTGDFDPAGLEWRIWSVGPEPLPEHVLRVDDPAMEARLRALPVGRGAGWDVDWFYLPDTIAEGERPYHGRLTLCFDLATAACLAMNVIPIHAEVAERLRDQLLELILKTGVIPPRVRLRHPALIHQLGPMLTALGCNVELVDRLASTEGFRRGMMDFLGR